MIMPSCVLSNGSTKWLVRILGWIIHLVPLAVFAWWHGSSASRALASFRAWIGFS